MKARAAILFEVGKKLEIREVELQPPQAGEVLIQMAAAGICHSDKHVMTGHLAAPLPAILGHEGAGVVAEIGSGVDSLKPGDHVIPLWRLSCGVCEFCSDGRPALCGAGVQIRMTGRLLDGTTRFKLDGKEIKHFAGVSSFSEYSVIPEKALLKIPKDFPLDKASLLGCGVITGVGAVFNRARVKPGSTVAVFGTGGVGVNVVQGAAIAGAEKNHRGGHSGQQAGLCQAVWRHPSVQCFQGQSGGGNPHTHRRKRSGLRVRGDRQSGDDPSSL